MNERLPIFCLEFWSHVPDALDRYRYFLHWRTNYIPGHPDGEYGDHIRSQAYFATIDRLEPDRSAPGWQ